MRAARFAQQRLSNERWLAIPTCAYLCATAASCVVRAGRVARLHTGSQSVGHVQVIVRSTKVDV